MASIVGQRLDLRAERVRKGWTQVRLARKMSVSQQTIAKWERGQCTPQTLGQIRRLQSLLDTPMETLFPDVFGGDAFDGKQATEDIDCAGGR